ncbi:ABC transporter permease [Enterovirga rhinocerotis]|uniref:NitT/TauT family transport system permease protein/taurine transport system permease protein n=1 Tax=Enterovirga rhinocerotis TaxID=1339210 RepID=A0A4R7BWW7_9HYPH|nr:ABC transporter permease [Enterovirga rhinocerotis]TDR90428.1 NitT/TauT family transport system permease protein/taurine transport system permease protein [Enterovirga rhinocerotis]
MSLTPKQTRWLILALVVVLWEGLPRAGLIAPLFLPPLTQTLAAGFGDIHSYASHLLVTLGEVAVSLVFACGGGILVGAILGSIPKVGRLLLPLFSSLYAVPLVILYPVFTAWFGIGSESKIAFASIYGFFPTMLGTAAGIATIDPQYLVAARSMGANLPQRILRVVVPAAIPTVLSSFRIGGALVIVGVVVSEMLISSAGIGYLITSYRTVLDTPRVFAAILLVLILAIAFDGLVQLIERRTSAWRQSGRSPVIPGKAPRGSASAAAAP